AELAKLVDELRAERQEHLEAIARIDEMFARFGIDAEPAGAAAPARRGRATKKKDVAARQARKSKTKKATARTQSPASRGRRTRGQFAKTADESVLGFVKKHGNPNAAEVNTHWRKEGRGGKADNTLTKLVKAGQLKRVTAEG